MKKNCVADSNLNENKTHLHTQNTGRTGSK